MILCSVRTRLHSFQQLLHSDVLTVLTSLWPQRARCHLSYWCKVRAQKRNLGCTSELRCSRTDQPDHQPHELNWLTTPPLWERSQAASCSQSAFSSLNKFHQCWTFATRFPNCWMKLQLAKMQRQTYWSYTLELPWAPTAHRATQEEIKVKENKDKRTKSSSGWTSRSCWTSG